MLFLPAVNAHVAFIPVPKPVVAGVMVIVGTDVKLAVPGFGIANTISGAFSSWIP